MDGHREPTSERGTVRRAQNPFTKWRGGDRRGMGILVDITKTLLLKVPTSPL